MADSLYVCHFSNGHIKVGRSIEPIARVAAHADRVACLGVELVEHFIVECTGPSGPREQQLIARCADEAERRFQSEWFSGLEYEMVCDWAKHFATFEQQYDEAAAETFGARLSRARRAKGLTQSQLGEGMRPDGDDLQKAAVSAWEIGGSYPNTAQLRVICERLSVTADSLIFGAPSGLPDLGVDFHASVRALIALGHRQADIAGHCRCDQSCISDIATGRTKDPRYSIGAALVGLHAEILHKA